MGGFCLMTAETETAPRPLAGLRVLDATHIVAGPFCAMILADMGAEVIKIERPQGGERARLNDPFVSSEDGRQVSARFLAINRNKKSVTLDLRQPRGREIFERLAAVSDVLLDNWGPGALQRLNLGFDRLRQLNPGLIYASITGFGDSDGLRGPYSDWPANNPCVQGMGGWMEITGAPDGPPQMVGDNIGDSVPGVWTALGIMLALESRRQTGARPASGYGNVRLHGSPYHQHYALLPGHRAGYDPRPGEYDYCPTGAES